MKKFLFILLWLPLVLFGQAEFDEGVKITGGQPTVTTPTFFCTQQVDGLINLTPSSYIAKTATSLNINGSSYDLSADREWRVAQADTGVLTFAGLTTNDATHINIGAVTGWVINNEATPSTPASTYVNYAGATGVTVTTVGSGQSSYVMLSSAGVISFQNTFPTSAERKAKIWLGKVSHPAGSATLVVNEPDYTTSPLSFSRDLFQALGPYINDGVYAYANGANLNINITAGNIHGDGINFVNSRTTPNEIAMGPGIAQAFFYRTQTGGVTGAVTAISPGFYDVGGTVTAVPGANARATIQYIEAIPGQGYIIQYGQTWYDNISDAVAALGKETRVRWSNLNGNAIPIGVIVMRKDATSLNDTSQALFFNANKTGDFFGASAGFSTANLQTAYNNSLVPQILTSTALGALTVKRGSAADSDNIIVGQNGAGSAKFIVKGSGDVTANSFVKNGGTGSFLMDDGTTNSIYSTSNVQSGTTYTVVGGDNNKTIITTNSAAVTITIPNGLPSGFRCRVYQQGTGQVTISAAGTLRYSTFETPTTQEQRSVIGIMGITNETDVYKLFGQLSSI